MNDLIERAEALAHDLQALPLDQQIETLNAIRLILHAVSPFKDEPIDCVLWVQADSVRPNDYNPNVVAPPEMKLLKTSIEADGYTQPIVTYVTQQAGETKDEKRTVVDGAHRTRVGKETKSIQKRLHGYLPVTTVRDSRIDRNNLMAATIRHNRARGVHQVANMSEIVVELARRNWSDEKISLELGMEADEVLRLKQVAGLAEMFSNKGFSQAWEIIPD